MLRLQNIVKNYDSGPNEVHALKGISIDFRPCEFVAILGHSGCGKTTLLNIIGGLDHYSSGDLFIRGKSTKDFKDRDWDAYRNHSIGFVFQSYNLIPHQTVLANVELALTLSGVSRKERRRRAQAALEQVGLGDQTHKKPNQLSGGQMQRVAIARALVNDPEILLADEPTGALDSETSVQVMDLLQEIAKDRLVIMVTHNPELAAQYATRTVRLSDGEIIGDTDPYTEDGEIYPEPRVQKAGKTSMSFLTALSLSLNNLMTKKGRTVMTAFAGSIGIIGIALILSLSSGIQEYISQVEKDTLSSYPITLESNTMDAESMMSAMMQNQEAPDHDLSKVYSNNVINGMMDMMLSEQKSNNLSDFKAFIDSGDSGLEALTSDITYGYDTSLNVYKADTSDGAYQVYPSQVMPLLGMPSTGMGAVATENNPFMSSSEVWRCLIGDDELLSKQYEVLAGRMPESWNEIVIKVNENNEITDFTLYSLGLLDIDELKAAMNAKIAGDEDAALDTTVHAYTYDELLNLEFKLLPTTGYYEKQEDGTWQDKSQDEAYLLSKLDSAETLRVVGILRPSADASVSTTYGGVGYRRELMDHLVEAVANSEIVTQQEKNPDTDVFTGLPFDTGDTEASDPTMEDVAAYIGTLEEKDQQTAMANIEAMRQAGMSDEKIAAAFAERMGPAVSAATYEGNLEALGVSDLDHPAQINLYPVDFEAKDKIADIIADYNAGKAEADQITYTDYVGMMMRSITTIINAISYVLIAFVAISLVVSSIMIGIITNISVLERTKEIGILRAVGASKRDISRVFNAETVIIGLAAGLFGIGLTLILIVPINAIIQHLTDISAAAALPPMAAVILIAISVVLTLIAGSFPARGAAKKDPVVALRSE